MRAIREADFGAFAQHVLPHLMADPVRNNVACGLVENRRDGLVPIEPDGHWLWVRDANDALVGVAIMTPPHPLLLSDMPPVAIDALAAGLAADGVRLPGVTGPIALASRFARASADLTNTRAKPVMSLRILQLDEVRGPHGVPGRLREATTEDRDLLVDWSFAFGAEALPQQVNSLDAAARPVDLRLRQRGYASGCGAGMSQYALDHGSIACMLYTNLANPTSNRIYQDIGYRHITDAQEWSFS